MCQLWKIICLSFCLSKCGLSKCVHCDVVANTLTQWFPSLLLQRWLWRWPSEPAKFSANLLGWNFPVINFIPFHAGGIPRSLSCALVRVGIFFISARWALSFTDAACFGKKKKKKSVYKEVIPKRPWHEKHLEKQMLFPHCQEWSDQNKMYLSPPLQHNQEKQVGGRSASWWLIYFRLSHFPELLFIFAVFFLQY